MVVVQVSTLLEPLMITLDWFRFYVRLQLDGLFIPPNLHGSIIAVVWAIVLAMLVRALQGWTRIVAIMLIALIVAKVYGALPLA